MNYKKLIFIGLIAVLSNFIIASNDQQRLEEMQKLYNDGQAITTENVAIDIEILNKEIKQLKEQKTILQGFCNKHIKPTLYGTAGLTIAGFQIFCIAVHIHIFYHRKSRYFLYLKECLSRSRGDDYFIESHLFTTVPIALIPITKKLFSAARNHKQNTAETIEKIDVAIARNQAIIAQLQQQQQ